VDLLIRRPRLPRVNKLMGIGSHGFTNGYPSLSEAWRWRIMRYAEVEQTPPPRNSTQRVGRHANAAFHLGCGVTHVAAVGEAMRIATTRNRDFDADFLILATGFAIDPMQVPLLSGVASSIACWADRYTPPAQEASAVLARFPYLAPSFAFTEKIPGTVPWLRDLHCFNHAASLSLGKVSGDIPRISEGAAWLAEAICADFYSSDIEEHWQRLLAYEKPELLGDEWTES
jgi:cation diffusion facilitator CzcD-associated flavoprotein CzcO